MFINQSVTQTNFIKAASVAISLGGRLMDYGRDNIDPITRIAIQGSNEIRTTFNFHSETSKGDKVQEIFKYYRSLEFGEEIKGMPADHIMRYLHKVLAIRDDLHRKFSTVNQRLEKPEGAYETANTKLAACLMILGGKLVGMSRNNPQTVAYYLALPSDGKDLVDAFHLAWGEYSLDPDHVIYHMKGVLENREALIKATKIAQVLVEIKDQGKTYIVSASATPEQIQRTIERLG